MTDISALGATHGFSAGDLNIDGYVAAVPAYQKIYIADGRPFDSDINDSGYHVIDVVNTRLVGKASSEFYVGETLTQVTSDAKGIYQKTIVRDDGTLWYLVYRTTTAEFDITNTITGGISGATLIPSAVESPPHWLNWNIERLTEYEGSLTITEGYIESVDGETIVDSSLTTLFDEDDDLNGYTCRITSGTGKGSYALVTDYAASSGTITVADWLDEDGNPGGTNPAADSGYSLAYYNATSFIDEALKVLYTEAADLIGFTVKIVYGTGNGSYAVITNYDPALGKVIVADFLDASGTAGGTDPAYDSEYVLYNSASTSGALFPDGGSNAMCLFDGRVWMNSMYNPNQWTASRQGNPDDLDSLQTDVQSAIISQTSLIGLVGDALIGFIPFKDSYLLFGCANSFWILRGGSTGSGSIDNLSYETGLFSPSAFCWDSIGNLYVVGMNGFYKFPNNMGVSGVSPDNISNKLIPNLFKRLRLNRKTDRVVLGYDSENNNVHVSISMMDGSWSMCWIYDVENDAIFPDTFSSGHIPASFLYMNSYQDDISGLLMGNYDGYVRRFDDGTKNDDGEAIGSYVFFGPISMNNLMRANVKIREIQIILSEDSDGGEWELYQAESNESLIKGIVAGTLTPTHSGTFTAGGRQESIKEKISGESVGLIFKNYELAESWGFEGLKISYTIAGKAK